MSPRPYRTHWRTADLNRLQAMSVADGRPNDPYRPYEEERELIVEWSNQETELPHTLFLRWAIHPDERVRAELVRAPRIRFWVNTLSYPSRSVAKEDWENAFWNRIAADLREEGVYWTPLLDEIDCVHPRIDFHSAVEDAVNGLAPWLQTQATQEDVREMFDAFHGENIRKTILLHAGCIDQTFAREIYERAPDTDFVEALANNPHLPADVVAAFAEWLVKDWEAHIRNAPATRPFPRTYLVALLQQHRSAVPLDTLRRIYELPKLVRTAGGRKINYDEYLYARLTKREITTTKGALRELAFFSDQVINKNLPVPPDVLCATIPFIRRSAARLLTLLRHPNADITVWRAVINQTSVREIYELAAQNRKLRRDPEIRERLLRSGGPDILSLLAKDADPQLAADSVRFLMARGHLQRAAQALKDWPLKRPIALEPIDLAPLLRSDDPDIRLTAIASLSRLQVQTQPAPKTKPSQSVQIQRKKR